MEIETYKWDYEIVKSVNIENDLLSQLKEMGKKGWESCGVLRNGYDVLLRRPCGKVRIVTRDQAQNNGYENER